MYPSLKLVQLPCSTLLPYTTLFRSPQCSAIAPPGSSAITLESRSRSRIRSENTAPPRPDRKSTRLNSSHVAISYAVFCLKKKKKNKKIKIQHILQNTNTTDTKNRQQ